MRQMNLFKGVVRLLELKKKCNGEVLAVGDGTEMSVDRLVL